MSNLSPQRRELSLPDGALSYLEWKASAELQPLHFAHANGFNGETYKELLTPLAERFFIRAWDARGQGLSKLPADPTSLRDWYPHRDDMIALLEDFAAKAGKPVILAGHSLGGTVSLLAAAKRPDLVRALLLVEPVIMPTHLRLLSELSRLLGVQLGFPGLIRGALQRRAIFPSREEMFERYKGRGAFRTWPDQVLRDYIDGGTRIREDGQVELTCAPLWEAANYAAQGHDSYAALRQYSGPITLLYASEASTCRAPAPDRIGARGGEVLRVEGATHFLPMERPELVRQEAIALTA